MYVCYVVYSEGCCFAVLSYRFACFGVLLVYDDGLFLVWCFWFVDVT